MGCHENFSHDRENFNLAGGQPMTQFLSTFRDNNYYFGNFTFGPVTDYKKILATLQGGGTTPNVPYNLRNSFNIGERIWAGYVMNTISFGRLRLQAGLRVESTQDSLRAVTVVLDPNTGQFIVTPVSTNKSYVNPFPSVQAQYRFGSDTILRAAYGMGIARPNFGDSAPYFAEDPNSFPRFRAGNPNLKPTHGQNFDLLVEHYLKPLGLIQGGFFYKALTDPIYTFNVPYPNPTSTTVEANLVNGPNAHITWL